MRRVRHALFVVALGASFGLCGSCEGGSDPVDGGSDAGMPDARTLRDAAEPIVPLDARQPDAWMWPDVGPDLGPLGCSMPGVAMRVAMPVAGEEWTATLDPRMRADFHVMSCAPRARASDVVLALMPGASGRLVIETTDPALDTVLAVRARCDDEASEIACNDDAQYAGGPSRVTIDVTAGTPLYVIVDARGALAPIPLRAVILPVRRAGELCDVSGASDACEDGTSCLGTPARCRAASEGGCPPDGAFIDLDPLLEGRRARYDGTLEGLPDRTATIGCMGEGLSAGPEAVHRLTMPYRAKIDAIAYGIEANVLYMRTACGDPSSEIVCEGWGGITSGRSPIFEAGSEVFFFVERRPSAASPDYSLVVDLDRIVADGEPCAIVGLGIDRCEASSICRDEGGASRLCRPVLCGDGYLERDEECEAPVGVASDGCSDTCLRDDSCEAPIDLDLVGTPEGSALVFPGSNRGGADRFTPSCSTLAMTVPGGHEVFFSYTAPITGRLTVSTMGSGFDTVVSVLDGCGGTSLGCNDDVMSGMVWSRVNAPVTAGQRVLVVVDGFRETSVGDFLLRTEVTAP